MTSLKKEFSPDTKAVIYARVSSAKKTTRGDGLGSQETRCREFAKYKGCEVVNVFKDDMTGSMTTRPGMQSMLSFLRKHRRKENIVVIIDDISRLARSIEAHLQLRTMISEAGGILTSPTIEFGEDSDSILVENLLASVSQHQRQKNGEQTINRMRSRVMSGYWCFQAPIGYKYQRTSGRGNMIVRDEPYAMLLQEALEGYASGRFETQVEVKRYLESCPDFPKDKSTGEVHNQRVHDFLTRPVYAGYLEAPNWNVSLRKGQHEGLINFETFQKIQNRLTSNAKASARKDINADFPLRGFILCDDCQKPLTACWSKGGSGKKHPYYLCPTKGCASYRKSIKRDVLEGDFTALLQSLEPTQGLITIAKAMFKNAWSQRQEQSELFLIGHTKNIEKLDKQIEHLLDRIVSASSLGVVTAYEKRIDLLEKEKLVLASKVENSTPSKHTFDDLFERALEFLSNPCNLWDSGQLTMRRTVLRLAFAERIAYCRNQGLRTPQLSLPFSMLDVFRNGKKEMVHPERFERPTP